MIMPKPLTTKDIATYCNVTQRAVVQWINHGKLKAFRTPGNHIRVDKRDFNKFLKEFDINLPETETAVDTDKKVKKVLIIDDDMDMASAIKRTLSQEGNFEVETANDGFDAGYKLGILMPDVVILDVYMPGINGYQICSKLRSINGHQNLKILAVTGSNSQEDSDNILSRGADDYLFKPFSNNDILNKVMTLVGWTRRASDRR